MTGSLMIIGAIIVGTVEATKAKGLRTGIIFACLTTAFFTWAGGIKG